MTTPAINPRTTPPSQGYVLAAASAGFDCRTGGPATGQCSCRITVGGAGDLVVTYCDQVSELVGDAITIPGAIWAVSPSMWMQIKKIHTTSTATNVLIEW